MVHKTMIGIRKFESAYPNYDRHSRTATEKLLASVCTPRKINNYIFQEFIIPVDIYDSLEESLLDGKERYYEFDISSRPVEFCLAFRQGRIKGVCMNTHELVLFKRESTTTVIHLTGDRLRDLL